MKMNLPDVSQFQAVIFDLDGTLIDSMPAHIQAWRDALAVHGLSIESAVLTEFAGIPTVTTVELLNKRFGWKLDPVAFAEEKERHYRTKMDRIELIKPVFEIAKAYNGKKPMAIVTGGPRDLVREVMALHKLDSLFKVVICAEDTEKSKEFADPFLLAAKKINVDPTKCIFFDDGDAGLRGAKAAGMTVFKIG